MARTFYHPDPYWSVVSNDVNGLKDISPDIGNKDPYYRYKRRKFIKLVHSVDFQDKHVLEVGCGPGSTIREIWGKNPSKLDGIEENKDLRTIAKKNVPEGVEIKKTDGTSLPYSDKSFDYIFTAEVLQHMRSINQMNRLMNDMARVARDKIILFERIETEVTEDEDSIGRTLTYYRELFDRIDFQLKEHQFIQMSVSQSWCGPLHQPTSTMDRFKLPLAKIMDGEADRGIAKVVFERI